MGLWWLLALVAIVWLVVALARRKAPGRQGPSPHDRRPEHDVALQILRERYARGEIEKEEFDRRRAGLA